MSLTIPSYSEDEPSDDRGLALFILEPGGGKNKSKLYENKIDLHPSLRNRRYIAAPWCTAVCTTALKHGAAGKGGGGGQAL